MFNVCALLLDDALEPTTPLIAPLISGVAVLSASSSSKEDKNSSGDEIANVNFLRDIVHVEASAYAH